MATKQWLPFHYRELIYGHAAHTNDHAVLNLLSSGCAGRRVVRASIVSALTYSRPF